MFQFLKRRAQPKQPAQDPAPAAPSADTAVTPASTVTEPRAHHFTFSQVVVPQVAWRDPMTFFGALKMDRDRFVTYLLDVNRDINQKNRDPFRLLADDLHIKTTVIKPWPCLLFKLPEPRCAGETHLIAVVLLLDPRAKEADLDPQKGPAVAIFNLDRAEQGTQVSEWRGEERLVHPVGPAVGENAFLHWVAATLASRRR